MVSVTSRFVVDSTAIAVTVSQLRPSSRATAATAARSMISRRGTEFAHRLVLVRPARASRSESWQNTSRSQAVLVQR